MARAAPSMTLEAAWTLTAHLTSCLSKPLWYPPWQCLFLEKPGTCACEREVQS